MKRSSTIFLRVVVILMGAVAVLLCFLVLPAINAEWGSEYPEFAYLKFPFMVVLAATIVPFFIALYQTLKLLHYVDKNTAFSALSVRVLKHIKGCAVIFSALYAASMPFFYIIGDREDAPGIVVIGMIMTFAPMVIAVFVAVLQKLLQNAIDIKSENDLTV